MFEAQKFIQNFVGKIGPGINLAEFNGGFWEGVSSGVLDDRKIATNHSKYYDLASLTKTVTATKILILHEAAELDIDQHPGRFLPYLKPFELTIRDLLTHSHGLSHLQYFDKTRHYNKPELINILKNPSNIIQKDIENYEYTDFGYDCLGDILEIVFSSRLDEVAEHFCQHYNIQGLTYLPHEKGIPNENIAKTRVDLKQGQPFDARAKMYRGLAGHAGIFGNLEGLKQFVEAWINNLFGFSRKLYEQAFVPELYPNSQGASYGLVWRRGVYSKHYANHSGYNGPSIFLNPVLKHAVVHTCNWTLQSDSESQREAFRDWNRELGHAL